jgi:hypothetical protein
MKNKIQIQNLKRIRRNINKKKLLGILMFKKKMKIKVKAKVKVKVKVKIKITKSKIILTNKIKLNPKLVNNK